MTITVKLIYAPNKNTKFFLLQTLKTKDIKVLLFIVEYYTIKTENISHSPNTLGKDMNPIILPPAMGK